HRGELCSSRAAKHQYQHGKGAKRGDHGHRAALNVPAEKIEQVAQDKTLADEMAVLHGKIILLLADDRLKVLANEWSSSLCENSVYYVWRTDEGGQLWLVLAVPVGAEMCETRSAAAP